MNRHRLYQTALCILAASVLFAVGCSKLTNDNYNQLEVGMSYDEVVSLIGKADDCASTMGMKSCTWGNVAKHIKVQFAGDTVVLFSSKGL
ncbi:lipoprotein [Desulfoluna limicola]|uniref:Lipoprotein n=1 Tax=Desulfoluna limicola TaxID=2810562 RepID=A0ABM7PK86_9BACT|nr:DUF3862 domain-containing protein [Desulfoluna limicola]BCS97814.1 lipoprotein [Desulfoluna limicola]